MNDEEQATAAIPSGLLAKAVAAYEAVPPGHRWKERGIEAALMVLVEHVAAEGRKDDRFIEGLREAAALVRPLVNPAEAADVIEQAAGELERDRLEWARERAAMEER